MATKISFDLNDDDMKILERIITSLTKTQGSASRTTAIRFALRRAAKGLPKPS
jgi:hypothetical protein